MKLTMKNLLLGLGSIGVVAAPVVAVVACTDDEPTKGSTTGVKVTYALTDDVKVWHEIFKPSKLTVKEGETVGISSWTHTLTAADVASLQAARTAGDQDKMVEAVFTLFAGTATFQQLDDATGHIGSTDLHHGSSIVITKTPTTQTQGNTTTHSGNTTTQTTGATTAQIAAAKDAITKAKDAGITAINGAKDAAAVTAAVSAAKTAIDAAFTAPVKLSDVQTEVTAAKAALDSAATTKNGTFGATTAQTTGATTGAALALSAGTVDLSTKADGIWHEMAAGGHMAAYVAGLDGKTIGAIEGTHKYELAYDKAKQDTLTKAVIAKHANVQESLVYSVSAALVAQSWDEAAVNTAMQDSAKAAEAKALYEKFIVIGGLNANRAHSAGITQGSFDAINSAFAVKAVVAQTANTAALSAGTLDLINGVAISGRTYMIDASWHHLIIAGTELHHSSKGSLTDTSVLGAIVNNKVYEITYNKAEQGKLVDAIIAKVHSTAAGNKQQAIVYMMATALVAKSWDEAVIKTALADANKLAEAKALYDAFIAVNGAGLAGAAGAPHHTDANALTFDSINTPYLA